MLVLRPPQHHPCLCRVLARSFVKIVPLNLDSLIYVSQMFFEQVMLGWGSVVVVVVLVVAGGGM
jgi:hypothetical protein